ncbi:right-handed parallel beta-helix repeat-containing protein [Dokdonella immobilis]|uniref:right-handed parallel beta-helix repeat-containing protein n=1 Tax=Dokdonella immobilis TaxID=578942 RepID=UPI0011134EB2|nr:right-handed parallel beta-helix repeat-containing protein [Dokdonella immobilis]
MNLSVEAIKEKSIVNRYFQVVLAILALAYAGAADAALTYSIGDKCYLPGPYASNRCSVRWGFSGNSSNKILCLWNGDNVSDCQGYSNYANTYDYGYSGSNALEIRWHTVWPTNDPSWPDTHAVRLHGTLMYSKTLTVASTSISNPGCSVTVDNQSVIQQTLDSQPTGAVICISPGTKVVSSLNPKAGQTLKSSNPSNKAILTNPGSGSGERIIASSNSGITIRDLVVQGNTTVRPEYGILLYGTSQKVHNVDVAYSLIGIGLNGAVNAQIDNSSVSYAGDGVACSGCAQPSIWVNNSGDVRILSTSILNNGVGPEGDGEIACYNTNNLLIQGSMISYSGASGVFLVACDNAQIIGNQVDHSKEWGLDIVNLSYPTGSDYGLFLENTVSYSRNGGAVLKDSQAALFKNNSYLSNRQGPSASGSCNGVNRRGNTAGFYAINDYSSPSGTACSD